MEIRRPLVCLSHSKQTGLAVERAKKRERNRGPIRPEAVGQNHCRMPGEICSNELWKSAHERRRGNDVHRLEELIPLRDRPIVRTLLYQLAVTVRPCEWIKSRRLTSHQRCCPTGLELLRRGTLSLSDAVGMGAFLLPLALFWPGAHREWRWAMWLALLATTIWLGLQLWTWWPPYPFGASEHWSQVYARAFAQSTAILPRWGNHRPPDAMHVVLQVMVVRQLRNRGDGTSTAPTAV